jgi:hypothetical protein
VTTIAPRAVHVAEPDAKFAAALESARTLERWGSTRGWLGPDPYDALNATRLPQLTRRSPLALRVVTQAVKRSPLNLRPILGVPDGLSAATLAHVISAYAGNGFLDAQEAHDKLRRCIDGLTALRCTAYPEPCWGYHFDVQTRVFFYPRTSPNTIATAFAGHAFLDAHDRTGDSRWLDVARGIADFFLAHVPSTETSEGIFFGYLVGDRTPIHNANMLVCSLLARLAHRARSPELADLASAGIAYTIAHQRPDGSWPYGERPNLAWTDNFHTGYVLEALLRCRSAGITNENLGPALERGLNFYGAGLFRADGAPKYYPSSLYPIDVQCAAQGIETFALAAGIDNRYADRAWRTADYALTNLRRRDGSFIFQRSRLWSNRTPHMRWCEAPMLRALSRLLTLPTPAHQP